MDDIVDGGGTLLRLVHELLALLRVGGAEAFDVAEEIEDGARGKFDAELLNDVTQQAPRAGAGRRSRGACTALSAIAGALDADGGLD